jgi:hypothetical protein
MSCISLKDDMRQKNWLPKYEYKPS